MSTFKSSSSHSLILNSQDQAEFLRGIKTTLPMLLGFVPLALVLGTQAAQKGFSIVEVSLLTGLNFAGGSEFAILEVWTNPPQFLLLMFITFLINSRHLLMGASLVPYLRHLPDRQVYPALFFLCDESWALGLSNAQKRIHLVGLRHAFNMPYYAGVCLALYVMWVSVTTLGAVLGPVLGDIHPYGFDMAFPAIILVLLRGMWTGFAAARPWLVSLVVAAISYLYLPAGWHVPLGAISGVASALFLIGEDK